MPFDFTLGGRYRLVAPLGEGGMATVYRARDLRLNREVAVKVLHEDLTRDPAFLGRFQREAQTVASLSHPNIVPVYDVGEEDGSHYIVMEYIRGRTLRELLESGPLPSGRAIAIMTPVLDALAYAHGRGLVHRDVKPQNILISQDGTPRLTDFGIVHVADGSMTRTAVILGSAHYLSPEQARGEEAVPASDIYAAGAVLYEMLSGRPPFDGSNALAIATQHVHGTPAPLGHEVPSSVAAATMRALAKRPADRFRDAAAFAAALAERSSQPAETQALLPVVVDDEPETPPIIRRTGAALSPAREGENVVVLRRSARKAIVAWAILFCLLAGLLALGSVAGLVRQLPDYPSAPYAVLPGLLALGIALSWLNTRSWVYQMDHHAAMVQWGVFGHHRFGVPVRSITTLELKQSPIDRVLGVGTVELCARDQHGRERRVIMEDLPHPRQTYEELMHQLGRALHRQRAGR